MPPLAPELDDSAPHGPPQSPERRLWLEVLRQALCDLGGWQGDKTRHEESRILAWLGTADFGRVCLNAGLEPEAVEARFRQLIKERNDDH